MRIYDANLIKRFIERIKDDPSVEICDIPPQSEYEILRYRREEYCQDVPTGGFNYGFVYRNNRGRFTLVGQAVEDYRSEQ